MRHPMTPSEQAHCTGILRAAWEAASNTLAWTRDDFDRSIAFADERDTDIAGGERYAYSVFRDYPRPQAIDIITRRLWELGAETALDSWLERVAFVAPEMLASGEEVAA